MCSILRLKKGNDCYYCNNDGKMVLGEYFDDNLAYVLIYCHVDFYWYFYWYSYFVSFYSINQFRAAEYLLNDEDDDKNKKKLNKAQRKSIFVRKNKVKKGDSSSEDVNIEVANTVAKAIEEVDELEKERTAEQLKEIEAHQLNLLPEVFLFCFA